MMLRHLILYENTYEKEYFYKYNKFKKIIIYCLQIT